MSKPSKKVNAKMMHKQAAKDASMLKSKPKVHLSYEFCPLADWLSILHLLLKHFCLHPLLPEHYGQAQSSEQIHCISVYKIYLHCKTDPEALGNCSWLTRMQGGQTDDNAPAVSAISVCKSHIKYIHTDLGWVDAFLTFKITSHWY